jgi:hypothetical protein
MLGGPGETDILGATMHVPATPPEVLTMTGWEYFAVCLERETSYENPSTIARRRPESGDAGAEWLTGEGRWQRTDAFVRRAEGSTEAELVPIDHDRARSIAATALAGGRIPRVPDDLE